MTCCMLIFDGCTFVLGVIYRSPISLASDLIVEHIHRRVKRAPVIAPDTS